jgi:hypothetical protein
MSEIQIPAQANILKRLVEKMGIKRSDPLAVTLVVVGIWLLFFGNCPNIVAQTWIMLGGVMDYLQQRPRQKVVNISGDLTLNPGDIF